MGNATTEIADGISSKIKGGVGVNFTALGKILLLIICLGYSIKDQRYLEIPQASLILLIL